jgi:diguanylate cyclase (GGDEF)-like protein
MLLDAAQAADPNSQPYLGSPTRPLLWNNLSRTLFAAHPRQSAGETLLRPQSTFVDPRLSVRARAIILSVAAVTAGLHSLVLGRLLAGACLSLAGPAYVLLTTFLGILDRRRSPHHTAVTTCDILLITAIVWCTGGVHSEYYLLYYLPIIIAGLRLDLRDGIAASILSGSLYVLVAVSVDSHRSVVTTAPLRVFTVCISAIVLVVLFALLKRQVALYDGLRDALHGSLSRVAAVYDVAHAANVGKNLADLLSILLDHAARGTRAEHGCVYLLTTEGRLRPTASLGASSHSGALCVSYPSAPAQQALKGDSAVVSSPEEHAPASPDLASRWLVYLPLKSPAAPIGVLALASRPGHKFSQRQLEFLASLCAEAALTIENAQLRAELHRLAVTDHLTGLPNRRDIEHRLLTQLPLAQRHHKPLSLLMLDVDNLKTINDHYGHAAGDEVLCAVGHLLQANLRDSDAAGRIGGDEFMVVLPGANASQAAAIADRLIRGFAENVRRLTTLEKAEHVATLTGLSIGVAESLEDEPSARALSARADAALYQAKRTGKNRSTTAPAEHQSVAQRAEDPVPL